MTPSTATSTRITAMEVANLRACELRDSVWQSARALPGSDVGQSMDRLFHAIGLLGAANVEGSAEGALEHSKELTRLAGILRDCGQLVDSSGRIRHLMEAAAAFLGTTTRGVAAPEQAFLETSARPFDMNAQQRFEQWRQRNFPDVDAGAMRAAFWASHWMGRMEADAIWASAYEDRLSDERRINNELREEIANLNAALASGDA